MIFLKLGGSLITDKTRDNTPRLEVIHRLARELAACIPNLRISRSPLSSWATAAAPSATPQRNVTARAPASPTQAAGAASLKCRWPQRA